MSSPFPKQLLDPVTIAGDAAATADAISLRGAEASPLVVRPADGTRLWVEDEYDELATEQTALWEAQALSDARQARVRRSGLELRATELNHAIAGSRELLDLARTQYAEASTLLSSYRRRAIGSKRWYQAAKGVIFLGDLAGFATAAIWLGETTFIALTLAASAAAATVAAGLIGTEYSDQRLRSLRAQPPEELSPSLAPFAHLFTDGAGGASIMKRVLLLSLMTAVMVSVGIGALRATVDEGYRTKRVDGIPIYPHQHALKQATLYPGTLNCAKNVKHDQLPAMQQHTREKGKTAAGTQRWRCPNCGASSIRQRPDVTAKHQLRRFLTWLLSKDAQPQQGGPSAARQFRRDTSWCWNIDPHLGPVTTTHHTILVDGIYIGPWCLLIAVPCVSGLGESTGS